MSLLDSAKKEVGTSTKVDSTKVDSTKVDSTGKKSNNDYQKRARAKALESALLLKEELAQKKIELSDKGKEALSYLCKEGGRTANTSTFEKIFGANAKAGDKITALKVFETSGKGFAEMRKLMKQWKEKQHITVEYDEATKSYIVR